MKKSTLLVTLSLFGLSFIGCSEEEAPAELPMPSVPATEAPSVAPASEPQTVTEPELRPIEPVAPASISEPVTAGLMNSTGNYVIQVGIQPSKKGANRIANKLSESGIESYLAQVENPGELEGTYYRVRIGYFSTVTDAKTYAKNTLEPMGLAWWVDSRRNDEVGNPAGSEDAIPDSYYSEPQAPASSDWNNQPEPTPEPTPVAQPEPAAATPPPPATTIPAGGDDWGAPAEPAAPAPQPAAAPVAQPTPAPAPVSEPSSDDWDAPAPSANPPSTPPAASNVIEDDGWN